MSGLVHARGQEPLHGLLVLDKPGGMTSRDAVDLAQAWFPRRTRVGHTGTLDPLATGVLVLGLGAATRLTEYVQRMTKTYRAGVRLGGRSETDDADGAITPVAVDTPPAMHEVRHALDRFLGTTAQVPPAYSAAKVDGSRAYALARQGEDVALSPKPVRIDRIEVLSFDYPCLEIEVICGKGTYIRSLARDLGEVLGCGGYVETLRRTRVGAFRAEDAVSPRATREEALARLLPLAVAVSELPAVRPGAGLVTRLRNGQMIHLAQPVVGASDGDEVAVYDPTGGLAAVSALAGGGTRLRSGKVFGRV